MKRSCTILFGIAALVVALALPGIARADESTDGWTWTDNGASVDGWSWGDGQAAAPAPEPAAEPAPPPASEPAGDPAPDGWSWGGEASAPAPDGWSWSE